MDFAQPMDRNFLSLLYEEELECLIRSAIKEPATRPDFFELLAHSRVYVFRAGPSSPSAKATPRREILTVLSWKLSDGSIGTPFFTSLPALKRCQGGRPNFFEVEATELIAFSGHNRLIVNPGSIETLEFYAEEMVAAQSAENKPAFKPVWMRRSSINVLLAPLIEAPTRMIRALGILCNCYKNIEAAFIAKIKYIPNDQKAGYVIGVVADSDINVATMAVQAVAQKNLQPNEYIELVGLDDSEPEMREYFNNHIAPFYRREPLEPAVPAIEPIAADMQFLPPHMRWMENMKRLTPPGWTSSLSESVRRIVHWHE